MVGFSATTVEPPLHIKFVSAGLAGCIADAMTFPLDVAKVRLQIQGEVGEAKTAFKYRGMFGTIVTIARQEGPLALYNGIVPGLQRQVCFCSVRLGLYDTVKGQYIKFFNAQDSGGANVLLRILAACTTGAIAVSVAQPTDVVKVRMQAQDRLNKRYHNSRQAYSQIAKHEGVKGLWKGVLPNITRNAIVNAAELVSYDLIKEQILKYKLMSDNMPCHFVSAFGAGFCTTVIASPVDVVKTRYMNSPKGAYAGATQCAVAMWREGGGIAFYKGFMPSFMRLASWNIAMFVCFEQLKRAFIKAGGYDKDIPSDVDLKDLEAPPTMHASKL